MKRRPALISVAVVIVLAIFAIFYIAIKASINEEAKCRESGGEWVIAYYMAQPITVGKSVIINNVPIYECRY